MAISLTLWDIRIPQACLLIEWVWISRACQENCFRISDREFVEEVESF